MTGRERSEQNFQNSILDMYFKKRGELNTGVGNLIFGIIDFFLIWNLYYKISWIFLN